MDRGPLELAGRSGLRVWLRVEMGRRRRESKLAVVRTGFEWVGAVVCPGRSHFRRRPGRNSRDVLSHHHTDVDCLRPVTCPQMVAPLDVTSGAHDIPLAA